MDMDSQLAVLLMLDILGRLRNVNTQEIQLNKCFSVGQFFLRWNNTDRA
jgi:hypothetical protein